MILKDVLQKTAELLGVTATFGETLTDDEKLLVKCGDSVIAELVEECIDVKTSEKLYAFDKEILYSSFSKKVKSIISAVYDGKKVPFTEYADRMTLPLSGEYEIRYNFTLGDLALTSELCLPPKYTANVLAAGVAGEFCRRKGLYTESEAYSARYAGAIKNLSYSARKVTLRSREF